MHNAFKSAIVRGLCILAEPYFTIPFALILYPFAGIRNTAILGSSLFVFGIIAVGYKRSITKPEKAHPAQDFMENGE